MSKKKEHNYARNTLILGVTLTIFAPLLLSGFSISKIGSYSNIATAIGGVTSPIMQLMGSVLIFIALKDQLEANKIAQTQIVENEKQQSREHELQQIQQLFIFFDNTIKEYTYVSSDNTLVNSEKPILSGRRAIKCFLHDIQTLTIDEEHNKEQVIKRDGVKEILSIIDSAKLFLEKIENSNVPNDDKLFYKKLIHHQLIFGVFPDSELDVFSNTKLKECEVCDLNHGNYPPLVYQGILDLKKYFK